MSRVASCLWLIGVASCGAPSAFDGETRALLDDYALPASPPADPSNAYADDPRAQVLGKQWYFDPRFSGALGPANDGVTNGSLGPAGATGKVSCASCHDPGAGGGDRRSRPSATSLGAAYMARNASAVVNAAYSDVAAGGWQFWDGRKDSLWSLALTAGESTTAHNGTRLSFAHVIYDHYKADYEAVFGPLPPLASTARFPPDGKPGMPAYDTMAAADRDAVDRVFANYGKAIEAYERLLVSRRFEPSAFDRMLAGDDQAMSPAAIRGAALFVGKAACNECHRGAAFTDHKFHNIGTPQEGDHAPLEDLGRQAGIATVLGDRFNRAGAYSDQVDDRHLRGLAATPADTGAFKTPTLRNVALTAPYMHDGAYPTLWDVVNHYNFGGATGSYAGTREVTIAPLLLSSREVDDLVAFLGALSDGPALADPAFPEGLTKPPVLAN